MGYNGFHRSVKAGVALAGVGAIAFATVPVPTPLEDVVVAAPAAYVAPPRVVNTEVEPVVLATVLEILAKGVVDTVSDTVEAIQYDVPAIFNRVVEQWPDIELTAWNHSLVAAALLAPIAPLVVGPFNYAVADAVATVFPQYGDEIRQGIPEFTQYAFSRLVGPFLSAFGSTGAIHQDYYDAGMEGDRLGQNLVLLGAPARVIEAFLFGGYGDLGPLLTGDPNAERVAAPGLFTPWGQWPVDRNIRTEDDGLPDNEFIPLSVSAELTETSTVALETTVEDATVTQAAVETAVVDEAAVDTTEETTEELVVEEAVTEETVADDETEETPAPRFGIQKGLDDLRKGVENLFTGGKSGAAKSSEKSDDADTDKADKADKADKTEKTENADKADKSEKSDKSDSGSSDSE
ncbi:hypothetical protein BVC93_16080 [Mycobacterium sp. MS1601]|nr:hypothetical protein BVC93_16080 [Mycobacterium sp. MS1601]